MKRQFDRLIHDLYDVAYAYGLQIWRRMDAWARQEMARALATEDEVPDVSLKNGQRCRAFVALHATHVHPYRSDLRYGVSSHIHIYVCRHSCR